MRSPWKFAKPSGPGFGISRSYYMTVLAGMPTLPAPSMIAAPKPKSGAVEGFAVPLTQSKDKAMLDSPMTRGQYVVASRDRKTVLKLMVMPTQEAGFDPEALARSPLASRFSQEVITRVRSCWHVLQLTFESHDPEVYPALDFMLLIAQRLGQTTSGIVADPVTQRYLMPEALFMLPRIDPVVDAREHVTVKHALKPSGTHLYTLGLTKIGQPEFEIADVPAEAADNGVVFLMAAAQGVFHGQLAPPGSTIGEFEARIGGVDRALFDGIQVIELLPPTGRPVGQVLADWRASLR